MIRARVEIGREMQTMAETPDGIELKGRHRLHPGRPIDVISRATGAPVVRPAVVHSCRIVELGSGGPIYVGECRWQ